MPAASEQQRTLFCIALAIKEKKTPESYSKRAAEMAATMSKETLSDYCHSKIKK